MENNVQDNEIRNVIFPLAVTKPDLYKKLVITGVIVFYIMCVFSYFTDGFLTNYLFLELMVIAMLLGIVSKIYDFVYRCTVENIIDEQLTGVVIGFSNKLLILQNDVVIDEVLTDEIKIRSVSDDEEETFFSKYTTVLDCFKDGELVTKVGIGKAVDIEGLTLKADMSRADEDIKIIYDDEDDDDFTDFDGFEDLGDDGDFV